MAVHCWGDRVHGKDTAQVQCMPTARKQNVKKEWRKKRGDWQGFRRNYGEAPVKITTGYCSWKLYFFFRVACNGFLPRLLSGFAMNTRRQVIDASRSELMDTTWHSFNERVGNCVTLGILLDHRNFIFSIIFLV